MMKSPAAARPRGSCLAAGILPDEVPDRRFCFVYGIKYKNILSGYPFHIHDKGGNTHVRFV